MDKKKSTGLLLSILGVLSLVLITAGVTYAFFTYAKEGATENVITTGTIKFMYSESVNGILIQNAIPVSDVSGPQLNGAREKFDFTITSTTPSKTAITYDVTARKYDSTLGNEEVKLFLTANDGNVATNVHNYASTVNTNSVTTGVLFSDLYTNHNYVVPAGTTRNDTTNQAIITSLPTGQQEVLLYTATIPAGQNTYTNNLTLRMWIKGGLTDADLDDSTDYSPLEYKKQSAETPEWITSTDYYAKTPTERADYSLMFAKYIGGVEANGLDEENAITQQALLDGVKNGNITDGDDYHQIQKYPLNDKSFKVKVNVYANAAVVS